MSQIPNEMPGPYHTDRQAADDAREVYRERPGGFTGANYERLIDTCVQTGITIGAFDHRILVWLSGWEPETCQVVIGLIRRAHAANAEGR